MKRKKEIGIKAREGQNTHTFVLLMALYPREFKAESYGILQLDRNPEPDSVTSRTAAARLPSHHRMSPSTSYTAATQLPGKRKKDFSLSPQEWSGAAVQEDEVERLKRRRMKVCCSLSVAELSAGKYRHTKSGDWLSHFPSTKPMKTFKRKTEQPIVQNQILLKKNLECRFSGQMHTFGCSGVHRYVYSSLPATCLEAERDRDNLYCTVHHHC